MELKTTVHRVFEDGSFETLAFPSETQTSVRKEAAPVQQGVVSALEFRADTVVTFDLLSTESEQKLGAREPDSGASMLAGESANSAVALPASDEVAQGDVLRYELTIHNANSYAVPPFALELIEHLPPGTTFIGLSSGAAEWALQLSPPGDEQTAGLASTQRTLRLQNTRALTAGQRSLFSYDVTVEKPHEGDVPNAKAQKEGKILPVGRLQSSIATAKNA